MSLPLVSCIMPTWNRWTFVPKAIKYFLRQDYPNKQLVILDDGDFKPTFDFPYGPEVCYCAHKRRSTLGEKRNMLVRAATGDLIAHWHDDDWYGPSRLSRQVEAMMSKGADICGLDTVIFHDLPSGHTYRYHFPYRPYLFCSTTMYTRAFWEARNFPEQDVQSSSPFIWPADIPDRLKNAVFMQDEDWFVGMVHLDNHNPKLYVPPFYKRLTQEEYDVRATVGQDWPFYEVLSENLPPRHPERGAGNTPPQRTVAA